MRLCKQRTLGQSDFIGNEDTEFNNVLRVEGVQEELDEADETRAHC